MTIVPIVVIIAFIIFVGNLFGQYQEVLPYIFDNWKDTGEYRILVQK